jgi:hypothetical protein
MSQRRSSYDHKSSVNTEPLLYPGKKVDIARITADSSHYTIDTISYVVSLSIYPTIHDAKHTFCCCVYFSTCVCAIVFLCCCFSHVIFCDVCRIRIVMIRVLREALSIAALHLAIPQSLVINFPTLRVRTKSTICRATASLPFCKNQRTKNQVNQKRESKETESKI